jgi:hypothetical protein
MKKDLLIDHQEDCKEQTLLWWWRLDCHKLCAGSLLCDTKYSHFLQQSLIMPFLSYRHAVQLRQELKDTRATVVTPEKEDFPELIGRWSDTCEKEAVCRKSTPVSPLPQP